MTNNKTNNEKLIKKLQSIDKEVAQGKRKVYTEAQMKERLSAPANSSTRTFGEERRCVGCGILLTGAFVSCACGHPCCGAKRCMEKLSELHKRKAKALERGGLANCVPAVAKIQTQQTQAHPLAASVRLGATKGGLPKLPPTGAANSDFESALKSLDQHTEFERGARWAREYTLAHPLFDAISFQRKALAQENNNNPIDLQIDDIIRTEKDYDMQMNKVEALFTIKNARKFQLAQIRKLWEESDKEAIEFMHKHYPKPDKMNIATYEIITRSFGFMERDNIFSRKLKELGV